MPVTWSDSFYDNAWASKGGSQESKDLNFTKFLSILARRWSYIVLSLVACGLIAWVIASRETPIYAASAVLKVNLNRPPSTDVLDEMSGRSESRSIETQVALLDLPSFKDEALSRLGMDLEDYQGLSTRVQQIKDTSLISINAEHPKPAVAQKVANALAEVYLQKSRVSNQSLVSNTRRFLEVQLAEKRDELAKKQKQLERAKRRLDSPNIELQIQQESNALVELETDLRNARVQKLAAEEQLKAVKGQMEDKEKTLVASVTTEANPIITQLQSQLASLETQRASALKDFQPGQPEVVLIESQIQTVRDQIKNESQKTVVASQQTVPNPLRMELLKSAAQYQADASSYAARERALTEAVDRQREKASELPGKERVLTALSNEVAVLTEAYNQLNQRYQSIRLDEEAKISDGQLMQPAELPTYPVRPQKEAMVLAGSFVGLFLGLLLVLLVESLDHSLRDPDQIEKGLGLPVLAGIPNIRSLPWAKTEVSEAPALHEGARLLQMAVSYNDPGAEIHSLMVTSPLDNEGKTTLAMQLGQVFAQSGKRVIVVDSDFRRFGLTQQFRASEKPGFTSLLDRPNRLESYLIPTEVPGLFVLPTGPLPKDPVDLIQSASYAEVVDRLKEISDLQIFDAPPLMVSDGFFLSRFTDGVVLVAVPGKTPAATVDRCVELLQRMQVRILGICLNKVQRFDVNSRYSQYRYGYYGRSSAKSNRVSQLLTALKPGDESKDTVSTNGHRTRS
jgi:capsular exopolysaccharide synthesis family protein